MDLRTSPVRLLRPDSQIELLNLVDKLRSGLLSQHVPLPEIIVCGDTSCGKSSVLEALSGVEFPVGSSVCTQFPTELILERSPERSSKYSIQPQAEHPPHVLERLRSFTGVLEEGSGIPNLINEAKKVMGIEGTGKITQDTLRLEIAGPDLPHLTLIDLPGLIHNASGENEVEDVEKLVKSYMKRDRCIILVVISVRSNIRSQGILKLVKDFDAQGQRSMGLITKPDLLSRESDDIEQEEFLELARNQNPDYKFGRLWHVLRNRSSQETRAAFNRTMAEQDLFGKAPWNKLSSAQLGLEALRKSLCDTLLEHICYELPKVVEDIRKEISRTKKRLDDLGSARVTSHEQRQFLTQISRKYDRLVQAALSGQYMEDAFFDTSVSPMTSSPRLRAQIRDLTEAFEVAMRRRGHTHELINTPFEMSQFFRKPVVPGQPLVISKKEMLSRVDKLLREHKGVELPGMFNHMLVEKLFREESLQWHAIAIQYSNDVCSITRTFLRDVITHISPTSTKTSELILRDVFDSAIQQMKKAISEKTAELMTPYVESFPFSTNRRLMASLKQVEAEDIATEVTNAPAEIQGSLDGPTASMQLLQWSRAYYNVALENFVDNMATLAVENCVLKPLPELFSAETILQMDDQRLQKIGGETQEITTQRLYEKQKLDILEKSLEICRTYVNIEFEGVEDPNKGLSRELHSLSFGSAPDLSSRPRGSFNFGVLLGSNATPEKKKRPGSPIDPPTSVASQSSKPTTDKHAYDFNSNTPKPAQILPAVPGAPDSVASGGLFGMQPKAPTPSIYPPIDWAAGCLVSGPSTPSSQTNVPTKGSSSATDRPGGPFGSSSVIPEPDAQKALPLFGFKSPSDNGFNSVAPQVIQGPWIPPSKGTAITPYAPLVYKEYARTEDRQTVEKLVASQSITLQPPYFAYSFEELRLADYRAGRRYTARDPA